VLVRVRRLSETREVAEMVREMRDGSVVVDVAIDKAAARDEPRRPTRHRQTSKKGVVQLLRQNMPGAVAHPSAPPR